MSAGVFNLVNDQETKMRKMRYVKLAVITLLLVPAIFMTVNTASAGEIANGYLYPGQSYKFGFLAPSNSEVLTFYGPPGATFGVELRGRADNTLGNWTFVNSYSLRLTGGGQFYVIVYSISGQGYWRAVW